MAILSSPLPPPVSLTTVQRPQSSTAPAATPPVAAAGSSIESASDAGELRGVVRDYPPSYPRRTRYETTCLGEICTLIFRCFYPIVRCLCCCFFWRRLCGRRVVQPRNDLPAPAPALEPVRANAPVPPLQAAPQPVLSVDEELEALLKTSKRKFFPAYQRLSRDTHVRVRAAVGNDRDSMLQIDSLLRGDREEGKRQGGFADRSAAIDYFIEHHQDKSRKAILEALPDRPAARIFLEIASRRSYEKRRFAGAFTALSYSMQSFIASYVDRPDVAREEITILMAKKDEEKNSRTVSSKPRFSSREQAVEHFVLNRWTPETSQKVLDCMKREQS